MLAAYQHKQCPTDELSAYIDGELDPARELQVEEHLAVCQACVSELNWQKQFLCDLTSSLMEDREIEMPVDFAKKVAVNAESSVSGLRRRGERYNVLLIGFSLLLFAMVALSLGDPDSSLQPAGALDQFTAVAGFALQLTYSFFVGLAVVLRSVAAIVPTNETGNAPMFFLILISLAAVSLRILSIRRA